MTPTDRLTIVAFRSAWAVVPRLPETVSIRIFNALADLAWIRNGKDVRRLQSNLARVTGESDAQRQRDLTRAAMRSYARYWRELFSIDGWSMDEILARVRIDGRERLEAALASGRGAVLAVTHSGNWDLTGVVIAHLFGGGTTVAERLRPEELFDAFVQAREKYGIEVIPHSGGPRSAFSVLLERARQGRLVALVSDRDLSSRGVEVDFFGATARMAAGPAALALAAGSPLLPASIWNDGDVVVFSIGEALPMVEDDTVASVTQRLADVFARYVAAHPVDWHMLQRVWIDKAAAS